MAGPRSLAALVSPLARRALGRHRSAAGVLLADWPLIVGAELAARTRPDRLTFPQGGSTAGTVTLAVDPADALEIQHSTATIIERVNAYYGYRAVERIAMRQVPLGPPGGRRPRPALSPADAASVDAAVDAAWPAAESARAGTPGRGTDEDEAFRARLAALGRALYARRR